jgi:hypothetical protein
MIGLMSDVTRILSAIDQGDPRAAEGHDLASPGPVTITSVSVCSSSLRMACSKSVPVPFSGSHHFLASS